MTVPGLRCPRTLSRRGCLVSADECSACKAKQYKATKTLPKRTALLTSHSRSQLLSNYSLMLGQLQETRQDNNRLYVVLARVPTEVFQLRSMHGVPLSLTFITQNLPP